MANPDPTSLTAHLRRLATGPAGALPDDELVRRFADRKDEAAFEVLVWRHGPMVWAACSRLLRHRQDAEDAFQATFLALARSARSSGPQRSVAGWLHRVARHAALKLKARRRPASALTHDVPDSPEDPAGWEVAGALDEELDRLPDRYRVAFVLCCLEGLTNAEAARELGCPVGTVDSRLHAARTRLRDRLARRGLGPAVLSGVAAGSAPAAVSTAAVGLGTGTHAPPPAIDRLANEVRRAVTRGPLAVTITAVALAALAGAAAVWGFDRPPPADPPTEPVRTTAPVPQPRDVGPSLLFTELVVKPGETGSRTLRLVRVPFRGGKPAGREELHTGDASEFGFGGRYRLIGDRFVVLQSATVVDIAQKKVVHTHAGENVLAVEGTRAFFDDRRDGGESGVFAFDAATGRREKVAETADARWWGGGAVSPDGTRRIVREWTGGPVKVGEEFVYKLAVERAGKPREVLDGEFAATCGTTGSGFMPDPPGVWLDNDRFLTQQTLGKLVVVNTADKTRRAVVEIPTALRPGERAWNVIGSDGFTPLGFQQPRFSLLPDGRAVYEADATYFVDVAKRTWEKPAWRPLGSGFDYSAVPDNITDVDRYSKAVTVSLRYRGEVIGTSRSVWWTTPEKPRVVVADGHLAVIERITRPGTAVPTDAVRVWTAAGGWAVLDGWADTVIGWVR